VFQVVEVTEHLTVQSLELVPLQVPETSDDTEAAFTPVVNLLNVGSTGEAICD
jgi:hypothetical protein